MGACTQADRIKRWFAPVTGDLRLGGRYQVEGNASGEVLACEPPRFFTVTWEFGGDSSQVTVRLAPDGDGARFTLEHEHTGDAHSDFWTQFGPGATGVGWDLALLGLAMHLIDRRGPPGGPGGFRSDCRAGSSSCAPPVIAGARRRYGRNPSEEAAAAAKSTTAFYLGD